MNTNEVLKLALEALEDLIPLCDPGFSVCYDVNKAITALREALAEQPVNQEYERGVIDGMQEQMRRSVDRAVNAMAQRTWVGLTDEERDEMIGVTDLSGTYYYDDLYAVILAAEGKLAEKNT